MSGRRQARSPGVVYSGVTAAMVVLIGALALTVRQAPPPPVAEFAPQVRQIKQAPAEQALVGGPSAGVTAPAPAPPVDVRPPGIRVVPRHLRCVGNPPRQIEDPQSPPCIAFWEGDNGGATWQGVTRDQITIVVPTAQNSTILREIQALEKFFNNRFQFYGRKIKLEISRTNGGESDIAVQKAHAADDAARYKPFAATNYFSALGFGYQQEMGRRGIIYAGMGGFDRSVLPASIYNYLMTTDELFPNIGEWICKRLVRQTAQHSGDPQLQVKRRVFGIIQVTREEDATTPDPLVREMGTCGEHPAYVSRNEIAVSGADPATASAVILKMQQEGVTSIVCLCTLFNFGVLQTSASKQGYFPEWLTSSYNGLDLNGFFKLGGSPPEQLAHTFGTTHGPRQITYSDEPFYWAARETDPGWAPAADQSATVEAALIPYRSLLILASGIQMAGPILTPKTFAAGLAKTVFPNPDHPNRAGAVSFLDGRKGLTADGGEWWWSNSAPSPFAGDGRGSVCYVDHGIRHRKGAWPRGSDDVFFRPDTECDSGAH